MSEPGPFDDFDLDADEIARQRRYNDSGNYDETELQTARRLVQEARAVAARIGETAQRAADDAARRIVNQRDGAPLVTIGLDTPVEDIRRWSGDPEDPEPEPAQTIRDVIVERAASMLAHSSRDLNRKVQERAMQMVEEGMRARVDALIEETLTNPVRKTNDWGEPVGEPTTLRAMVLKEAQGWLTRQPSRDGSRYRSDDATKASAAELVQKTVDEVMSRELAEQVKAAKAEVQKRVQTTAAGVIAKAVSDGLQLRG